MIVKEYKNAPSTADIILENEKGEILLIRRGKEPYKGLWALPGGHHDYFKEVDNRETLEQTAVRELEEETGLIVELLDLKQMKWYSAVDRDPRDNYVTHVYMASKFRGELEAKDDAEKVMWVKLEKVLEMNLAFDHKEILLDYLGRRTKIAGFNKILIVCSERVTEKHLAVTEKVKKILGNRNFKILKSRDLQEACFDNVDLVITIGGDGGFIRAARFLDKIPIIGINAEPEYSEGFLTSIDEGNVNLLEKVFRGEYEIIRRERARVKRNGVVLSELALSEIFLGAYVQFDTSRYIIKVNGQEERHKGSGILIATGTGSTAWFKSAGGETFSCYDKKLKFLVREAYIGERLFKPKLLKGEIKQGDKITLISDRYSSSIVSLDSNKSYEFNKGDIVEIEISDKPLNVIKIGGSK